MSQGWSKIFNRINWLNRPNTNTPLNATNLNAGDSAIDKLDDRIITLDTVKADMQVVNGMVSDVSLNESNGVLTITYKDGSTKTYDTNLEKIAVNFRYDSESERLILTMPDGTTQYVDLSALITQFEFVNSSTIAFSVSSSGKVSASIKNGSITEAMLETGYLANIKVEVAKAEAAVTQAQSSETASDYNAKLSQSYAIGGSGIRDGENTDNSKYYYEQASKSATASANSASTASTKASEAASSASSASASATQSATSENNASKSASSATASMSTASTKASEAAQSATSAGNSASTATSKAAAASTSASNAATSEANAKKYYEQAKAISESFSGALRPMGTVAFANLPSVGSASAGDMYNISDEFVTTSDFVEGSGTTEPAGSNVYKTEAGKWDVLAGSPVTGVKGANETTFRRGNVNITCANIGALATNGDSESNVVTFTSNDSTTGDSTAPALLTSGETHASIFSKVSTIFKNVRWLLSKMGETDISTIGNGTATGAISTLNSNLSTKQDASTAITTSNIASQSVSNADTVDGLHGWFLGTLNAAGIPHGTGLPMYCKYNAFGDARFGVCVDGYETRTHYATNSDYAANSGTANSATTATQLYNGYTSVVNSGEVLILRSNNYVTCRKYSDIDSLVPISASSFTNTSSKLVKENIKDMTNEEAKKILKINAITFDYIKEVGGNKNQRGVIAEDVINIIPSAVNVPDKYDESNFDITKGLDNDLLGVDYTKFIPYIIKMLQIQQDEIDELKRNIFNI